MPTLNVINIITNMINVICFKSIFQAVVFYTIIGIPILIVATIVYQRSVVSRKYFKCPGCGETFRAEFMDAKCCKVCGTTLERTYDENVTDKTF